MKYYYGNGNEVKGPVSGAELFQLLGAGELLPSSAVCEENTEEWVELRHVLPKITPSARPLNKADKQNINQISNYEQPHKNVHNASRYIVFYIFGTIIIILLFFSAIIQTSTLIKKTTKWEYKSLTFFVENQKERTGKGALNYSSIKLDDSTLTRMGQNGWEAVGCYLEMETAFPNFGNDDYVTGIRENIRPQSLVVIFKRPLK